MIEFIPNFGSNAEPVLLFLGAHSDDIEIGCGATVLTLAAEYPYAEIHWVVFSADNVRAQEAKSSAASLLEPFQKSYVEVHEFRNAYFPTQLGDIKDTFEHLKNRVSPDLVFAHEVSDFHQDHRVIGELAWNTFRNTTILEYEIPKFDGGLGDPNLFLTVTNEPQHNKHWFTRDLFSSLMRLRGVEGNSSTGLAEAFHCRKVSLGLRRN
jgi:LmbE family N-acetylglucosaminyl deacetylase